MGLLEEIDKLELSDELKAKLKSEASSEIGSKDDELTRLRRNSKRTSVESEIKDLAAFFGDKPEDQPVGLLKFVRRLYLSDDEQPGTVLLSDADLELSGDEASGARSEEEISVANAVRKVFELMPKKDGKLKVMLSDQAHAHQNNGGPQNEEDETEEARTQKRQRVESTLGRPVERKRTRYQGQVS